MAGILISPRVEQKIFGKRAAWKLKNGSPKFKDVLRQRCRLRIKERRALFIAQSRGLNDVVDVKESLTNIFHEEYNKFVQELESDFIDEHWDEEVFGEDNENNSKEDEWLMNQFDILLQDNAVEKLLDAMDAVFCPLCLKGNLTEVPARNMLWCGNCNMQVSGCSTLLQLQRQISNCLETHSLSGCCSNVNFLLNSEDGIPFLYSLCNDCFYFDIVG